MNEYSKKVARFVDYVMSQWCDCEYPGFALQLLCELRWPGRTFMFDDSEAVNDLGFHTCESVRDTGTGESAWDLLLAEVRRDPESIAHWPQMVSYTIYDRAGVPVPAAKG
jgi:hypothetical protein